MKIDKNKRERKKNVTRCATKLNKTLSHTHTYKHIHKRETSIFDEFSPPPTKTTITKVKEKKEFRVKVKIKHRAFHLVFWIICITKIGLAQNSIEKTWKNSSLKTIMTEFKKFVLK